MDKSWIHEPRVSTIYEAGVQRFLGFAFANASPNERIKCPCKNCSNIYYKSRDEAYEHLICYGVDEGYARGIWVFHGELALLNQTSCNVSLDEDVPDEVSDMPEILQSAFEIQDPKSGAHDPDEGPNAEEDHGDNSEFDDDTTSDLNDSGFAINISSSSKMNADASTSGSRARKRGRGPNRCIALNNLQKRIVVKLNEYHQPVGQNERLLSSYLGIIARDGQKAPINCADWRRMPMEMKKEMWEFVQLKFDIDERAKKWVFSKISHSWRNWKSELKRKYYDPFPTIWERLQHCPNRVNRRQWVSFVKFWGSKEGKERSKRNTKNRARQKMNHSAGTKSFARIREEERARNLDGQAPDRIKMFELTHIRKDGQPVDQASADALRQIHEKISQQPESSKSSTMRNDIFTQVIGEDKRGRVRTFGLGVTPSDIYGPRLSAAEARRMAKVERAQRITCEQSVVALEEQIGQMKFRMCQMETLLQRFTKSDQLSSSFEPVSGAPLDDIQCDG